MGFDFQVMFDDVHHGLDNLAGGEDLYDANHQLVGSSTSNFSRYQWAIARRSRGIPLDIE